MAEIKVLRETEEAPEEPSPYIVVTRDKRTRGPGANKVRHPGGPGYSIIFTADASEAELMQAAEDERENADALGISVIYVRPL